MQSTLSPRWQASPEALRFQHRFADFAQAFAFLTRVAALAEEQNHHPEIWNVYNQVKLSLNTHDAGNVVTDKDWALAEAIDALVV